jgi:hypothetical protein
MQIIQVIDEQPQLGASKLEFGQKLLHNLVYVC